MKTDDGDCADTLRVISATLGCELLSAEGADGHWILRRTKGPEVDIRQEPGRLLLACEMAMPKTAPSDSSGPENAEGLEAALIQAASGVDPMLRVKTDADQQIAYLELPVYLDGLSTQELARGQASLSRAVERMQDAAAVYRLLNENAREFEETMTEFVRDADGLQELNAEIEAMNRKQAAIPELDEEESTGGESAGVARICGSCQSTVPDGKPFCPACGAPMET